MEDEIDMVNSGIRFIYKIAEIKSENLSLLLHEHRVIPGHIFLHRPNNSVCPRLGGAAPEKLDAVKPHAEYPIELSSFAGGFELEDDFRQLCGRAVRGKCVIGENRRFSVGVAEVVVENPMRAGPLSCRKIGNGRLFDLEVASRW